MDETLKGDLAPMGTLKLSEEAMQDWRVRAILATKANGSRLGTVVLAMLGKPAKSPPWFGPTCVITPDGWVLSNFVDRHNTMHAATVVGSVEDVRSNLNGLADHIGATEEDREAMFLAFRQWVSADGRTERDALDRINPTTV